MTRGSGYRKERKGSPLANIFRQWCDAQARACIIVLQASGSSIIDTVLVDLSTLRSADLTRVRSPIHCAAAAVWPRSSKNMHLLLKLEEDRCSLFLLICRKSRSIAATVAISSLMLKYINNIESLNSGRSLQLIPVDMSQVKEHCSYCHNIIPHVEIYQ